ncbi:MAG TPA: CDP-2,3-bis-(O-geranylgeranyl)-sn-glycerol synthase [Candidatus Limnocylindrales bacterium]|nr:CDP-2,3-bis-(O-geranylgeranyl)-sn-glycerol synthase [Candidatus Limnocylindrales bacterium]
MTVNPMNVILLIADSLKFIFPAYCANATPVLAGGGTCMDFGKNFFDGKRVFGNNKTFRGFSFGLVIGVIVGLMDAALFHFPILFAFLIPLGALVGDLVGAFSKRRMGIEPGGLLPVVDQVDFAVGAIVFSIPLGIMSWQLAVTVLLITPPIHLLTNFFAYKMKLKKNPW